MLRLTVPVILVNNKRFSSGVSFLIIFIGMVFAVCMALVVNKVPGPDAVTLWNAYGRADNCNFWNPFSSERSSYECSAYLLRAAGMSLDNAWVYGISCNLLLTALPIIFFRRIPITIFIMLCLWGAVRSFFLEPLTKEIIVGLTVVVILLFSFSKQYKLGFFLSAITYGVLIRPYWVLFAVTWLGVDLLKSRVTKSNITLFLFVYYVAVVIAIQAILGYAVSSIRAGNNEMRIIGEEGSKTIIVPWFQGGDFVSQALDLLAIFFRLTFPFEVVVLSGPSQVVFLMLMAVTSFHILINITRRELQGDQCMKKVKDLSCIPLSFLMTQALFEPDFGSFARHFAMVVPILFCALGLKFRNPPRSSVSVGGDY